MRTNTTLQDRLWYNQNTAEFMMRYVTSFLLRSSTLYKRQILCLSLQFGQEGNPNNSTFAVITALFQSLYTIHTITIS